MRERVGVLTSAKGLRISTFHAFCARELRTFHAEAGIERDYTIYDTRDKLKLVTECLAGLSIKPETLKPTVASSQISKAKCRMQTPDQYIESAFNEFGENVGAVYQRYEREMRTRAALDWPEGLLLRARASRKRRTWVQAESRRMCRITLSTTIQKRLRR